MAIQVLPAATSSTLNADSYTVPEALKKYKIIKNFDAAVYTITTSPTSSEATVLFGGASSFPSTTTSSGAITYNLASSATNAFVSINTGTNVVVTITKVAAALSGAEMSGTLDTITSTGTYNQTGQLYVVAVGGGGGGGRGGSGYPNANYRYAAQGGRMGGVSGSLLYTNTATTITIGTAGNGSTNIGVDGNSGGTTTFGNLVSGYGGSGGTGYIGAGTSGKGGENGSNTYVNAVAGNIDNPTVINGSNGDGGGGGSLGAGGSGGGSGIGTGGAGGSGSGTTGVAGSNATGYGAGGGGGGCGNQNSASGGAGSPGVVYVLRGF